MQANHLLKAKRRFIQYVKVKPEGCWDWTGTKDKNGYGLFWLILPNNVKIYRASRAAFYLFKKSFDNKLYVCHKCDSVSCVRPSHLFLGTQADNMSDMVKKGRSTAGRSFAKACRGNTLNAEQVLQIRSLYNPNTREIKHLAKNFNVSKQVIWHIVHRKTWKHL